MAAAGAHSVRSSVVTLPSSRALVARRCASVSGSDVAALPPPSRTSCAYTKWARGVST
jgi:hypothetical protein